MPSGDLYIKKSDGSDWNESVIPAGTAGDKLVLNALGDPVWNGDNQVKSITIETPTASEDITWWYTDVAITIKKLNSGIMGDTTPSVTWTIRHNSDRSAAGNQVVTGGTTSTNTTTVVSTISFNDATIPAGSFIWVETTAQSGNVTELNVSMEYTED